MANQHDYINYNDPDVVMTRIPKKSSDFTEKEYRFKIKADAKNHEAINKFFKDVLIIPVNDLLILDYEYYIWEKEKG